MKVSRQLARLDPMVSAPLRGLAGEDWHRAPEGKWSIAQIVSHLAIGVDAVAAAFGRRVDKPSMSRRATPYESILRQLLLGVGRFPPGLEARAAVPAERPEPELAVAQFRMGVARLREFVETWPAERQTALFVRHPFVGDLNLPEWVRFHYVHCRHHVKQIESRREWLRRET